MRLALADKGSADFDNYNPADLENVTERQKKIFTYMKSKQIKKLHSTLIVIDDHADDPKFVRYSELLHGLFTRGRREAVSVNCSTQKYNVLASIIRLNASSLYIFRLKNASELMSFFEEHSATVDKQQLLDDTEYEFKRHKQHVSYQFRSDISITNDE